MPPRKKTPVTFDQWLGHVIDNEWNTDRGTRSVVVWSNAVTRRTH